MLQELRSRVLRKVFLAPSVVVPVVAGVSAWLLSWANDSVTALNLAGLISLFGGVGWAATRAIFGLEKFADQAYRELTLEASRSESDKLDQLDALLCQDNDPRDQELLRRLRLQRAQFRELASQNNLAARSQEVLSRVEQLFHASVKNLAECYKFWEQSKLLSRSEQRELLIEREKLLQEIRETVEQVQSSLAEFRRLANKSEGNDLAELRAELETSIEVAKRTEERLRELETSPGANYQPETE